MDCRVYVGMQMSSKLRDQLDARAARQGVSRSAVIRQACVFFLERTVTHVDGTLMMAEPVTSVERGD